MHPAIAIAIPASIGFAGTLLVARGLIGRRVQTEPHCRRCDYELTDLLTHRCPECGTVLHPDRIRNFRRIRRPRRVAWGLLLIAIAGSAWWFRVPQRIERFIVREEWYEYAPTAYVRRKAEEGDARWRKELLRRVLNESIDAGNFHDTVASALMRQKSPERYADAREWIDLLEVLCGKEQLNHSESQSFYLEIAEPSLQVRSRVRAGERIPFHISVWCAAPATHMYEWSFKPVRVLLDKQEVSSGSFTEERGAAMDTVARATRDCTIDSASLAVGPHRIEIQGTFELHNAPMELLGLAGLPLVRRELRLSATFEIIPANAPDTVALLNGMGAYRDLCTSFSASVKHLRRATDRANVVCVASIRLLKQLPCDVAFEAELISPDRSWSIGRIAIGKADRWPAVFQFDSIVLPPQEAVDAMYVRLIGSAGVARDSVSAFSIWDGTIEFPGNDTPQCRNFGFGRN